MDSSRDDTCDVRRPIKHQTLDGLAVSFIPTSAFGNHTRRGWPQNQNEPTNNPFALLSTDSTLPVASSTLFITFAPYYSYILPK